ncbi:MAG: tRNA lysidine(34) synthetase TilS [Terrimicrobiaceae bacterium]|nr:tRNA lysidine(34) synthetase TilS [Terrimicrobiaceae bacterium]
MPDPFLDRLAAGLGAWPKTRRALVAVSGGRDSAALLHGMHALGWRKLTVVHLDHRLRGAVSRADAKFVERLAGRLSLRCVTGRAEVRLYARERGLSLEHAAREMRRIFFAGVARRERCRTVFLAHHAEDQIETCLFNFLRGSGASGIAGMRPVSIQKIAGVELKMMRPMLHIRRNEIDTYLEAKRLAWREDATNRDLAHSRNRMRHRVMPVLAEAFGPSFPDAILRAAGILAAEDDWLRAEVERFGVEPDLSVRALTAVPLALRRRLVRRWLDRSGIDEAGFAETERVLSLLDATTGPAKVSLPGGCHARRRQGNIFLERP